MGWYMDNSRSLIGLKDLVTGASANTVYLIRNCFISLFTTSSQAPTVFIFCGGIKNINKMHKKALNRKTRYFYQVFVGVTGFEPVTLPIINRDELSQL